MLAASADDDAATTIERYVAKVALPRYLSRGQYRIHVSRDGETWVPLVGQSLEVRPDPIPGKLLEVEQFGCRADDGLDDTSCIRAAISKAGIGSGSQLTFVLGAGVWELTRDIAGGGLSLHLPNGVSLRGKGSTLTTLRRVLRPAMAQVGGDGAWFILHGDNRIEGIRFSDSAVYASLRQSGAVLQIGGGWRPSLKDRATTIANIAIHDNVFDGPFQAIANGGYPIKRLFVANNEFGAFYTAIDLSGYPQAGTLPFVVSDSVITGNVFLPSSYIDVAAGQGVIATQIGGSRRLDFSDNSADGTSTKYLYNPSRDAKGWRAAFFWHLYSNHEELLVSQNTATCTGDKAGDGEFLAFDNNQNTFGFASARPVVAATPDGVTVEGELQRQDGSTRRPDGYYAQHWLQVVSGTGFGQSRRILSYDEQDGRTQFRVQTPWDVVPRADSRIAVGLGFWQLLVIDNRVNHRSPPCLKSNRRRSSSNPYGGGPIVLWAQAADTVIAGNSLRDTTGVTLGPFHSSPGAGCGNCTASSMLQYFVDVRDNVIDGEYNWDSDCSWSGITVSYGASPTPAEMSPVIAYGLRIMVNTVIRADGLSGGAISIAPSWWDGPQSARADLIRGTIIDGNKISDIKGRPPASPCRRGIRARSAIRLASPNVTNTVIDGNTCSNVGARPVEDKGSGTLLIDRRSNHDGCERNTGRKPAERQEAPQ